MPSGRGRTTRHAVQKQTAPEYRDRNRFTIRGDATAEEVLAWLDVRIAKEGAPYGFPMELRDVLSKTSTFINCVNELRQYRDGWLDGMAVALDREDRECSS